MYAKMTYFDRCQLILQSLTVTSHIAKVLNNGCFLLFQLFKWIVSWLKIWLEATIVALQVHIILFWRIVQKLGRFGLQMPMCQ